jgi:hypothetical protein
LQAGRFGGPAVGKSGRVSEDWRRGIVAISWPLRGLYGAVAWDAMVIVYCSCFGSPSPIPYPLSCEAYVGRKGLISRLAAFKQDLSRAFRFCLCIYLNAYVYLVAA